MDSTNGQRDILSQSNNAQQRPAPHLQTNGLYSAQQSSVVAGQTERVPQVQHTIAAVPTIQSQSTAPRTIPVTPPIVFPLRPPEPQYQQSSQPKPLSPFTSLGSIPIVNNTTSRQQPPSPPGTPVTLHHAATAAEQMSDAVFQKYRQFIYSQTGIYFSDNKKYLLESKVQKRLNASKINTFEEYLNHISSIGKSASERLLFYEAITINETYFFRSEQQVDAMENIVIDQLCKAKNSSGSFRVWSAASSSGEEAYTMSLLITDKMKHRYPSVDFSVVGTDISSSVVETAKRGIYREYAVRNIPPSYMQKYFNKQNDTYHLSDSVKRMASFSVANLFDSADLRQLGKFDVIFCCNVLIYFDMLSKQQVVSSLYDALNPGGYLFIGYSESLHGISNAFEVVHFPKVLAYRRP